MLAHDVAHPELVKRVLEPRHRPREADHPIGIRARVDLPELFEQMIDVVLASFRVEGARVAELEPDAELPLEHAVDGVERALEMTSVVDHLRRVGGRRLDPHA